MYVVVRPEEMNVRGFDFHPLRGFKPTRYLVHVNGPPAKIFLRAWIVPWMPATRRN
jgi:hypothetical protein